jgi:membrane protein implicated in regulation of membrane protease activity
MIDQKSAQADSARMDWLTALFVVAGLALIASELVHTALVWVFLGTAALLVAGLRGLGVVDGVAASLLLWAVVSLALALPLRPLARRFVPKGHERRDDGDEDKAAAGTIVDVIDDVDDESEGGRIRFRGTTWEARAVEGRLPKGARAKLVYRDNMTWIVEALDLLEAADVVMPLQTTPKQTSDVQPDSRAKGKVS